MKTPTTLFVLATSAYSQLNLGDLSGAFGGGVAASSSGSSSSTSPSSSSPSEAVVNNTVSIPTPEEPAPPAQSSIPQSTIPDSSPAPPLQQQNTCPVCFDCRRGGCTNFGSCEANAACSCHDGWGFQDCSKPLCGGLSIYNTSRPVSNGTLPCDCVDGWTGPNCNVCAGKTEESLLLAPLLADDLLLYFN